MTCEFRKTLIVTGAAAGLLALMPGGAMAVTCTAGTGGSASTYTLVPAGASQCEIGNDTNTIDSAYTLFGQTGWILAAKNDSGDGDGAIGFAPAPMNGASSGSWGITALAGYDDVAVVLKAGNTFAAFDVTGTSGTWSILTPRGSGRDLSHASIYYLGETTAVPLPAAGLLLLLGIGGLAATRQRADA